MNSVKKQNRKKLLIKQAQLQTRCVLEDGATLILVTCGDLCIFKTQQLNISKVFS